MAKFTYDIELFISDVRKILVNNLNTKITAINTEKNTLTDETEDNFNIDLIPDNAFYFQQLPDVNSYQHFLMYGIADIKILEPQNDGHIQNISLFVEVALVDDGNVQIQSQIFKLLRYTRSLQEIFIANFDSIRGFGKLTVESLPPTIIELNTGGRLNSAGVIVSASIGIR